MTILLMMTMRMTMMMMKMMIMKMMIMKMMIMVMMIMKMMNIFNIYADVDAISMTPSRNTRSYTLRSVPSSPGRSFLAPKELYT